MLIHIHIYGWISGWWFQPIYHSEKYDFSKSVGMIFHSQPYLESQSKFHCSSQHQPDMDWSCIRPRSIQFHPERIWSCESWSKTDSTESFKIRRLGEGTPLAIGRLDSPGDQVEGFLERRTKSPSLHQPKENLVTSPYLVVHRNKYGTFLFLEIAEVRKSKIRSKGLHFLRVHLSWEALAQAWPTSFGVKVQPTSCWKKTAGGPPKNGSSWGLTISKLCRYR